MAAFAMSLLKLNFHAFDLSQFTDGFYEIIDIHETVYRTKMSHVNNRTSSRSLVKRGPILNQGQPAGWRRHSALRLTGTGALDLPDLRLLLQLLQSLSRICHHLC